MNRRALAWLLGLVLLGGGVLLFLHHFERREVELPLPPRGEARYNPLYALGNALRAYGHDVQVRALLDLDAMQLQPGELLLLASDLRTLGEDDSSALLDWVEEGGRLVFALPPLRQERLPPLLADLGLQPVDSAGCVRWRVDGAGAAASLCADSGLVPDEDHLAWWWEDAAGVALMARTGLGDGELLLLPSFRPFAGRALDDPNHAALAWQLLGPMLGDGRVHIVYAVDLPPLYVILARDGWMVWVPLLLALLGWLWQRSQRLGPVLPLAGSHRRALLEHVRAAGALAFRSGRGAVLHAALRRRFEARLAREAPQIAALDEVARIEAIAAAWQLDPGVVRSALQPVDLGRPDGFTAAIRSLSQLQVSR